MDFNTAYNKLLSLEGVSSTDKYGGATHLGVIQPTYDGYRDELGLARQSVFLMSDAEGRDIAYKGFWVPVSALPDGLDFMVFQEYYNTGSYGITILQGLVGVSQDGHIGPKTLAAVAAYPGGTNQLILDYSDAMRSHYEDRSLTRPDYPLQGLYNRVNNALVFVQGHLAASGMVLAFGLAGLLVFF